MGAVAAGGRSRRTLVRQVPGLEVSPRLPINSGAGAPRALIIG